MRRSTPCSSEHPSHLPFLTSTLAHAKQLTPPSGIETDILGFVAIDTSTQEIIVSIRGTSSLYNWLADVVWARQPTALCPGCWVHLGFLFAYGEIIKPVNASLAAATRLYPAYKVSVAGHSLGGAVGTLLAMRLRAEGYELDLYTYGAPRVVRCPPPPTPLPSSQTLARQHTPSLSRATRPLPNTSATSKRKARAATSASRTGRTSSRACRRSAASSGTRRPSTGWGRARRRARRMRRARWRSARGMRMRRATRARRGGRRWT